MVLFHAQTKLYNPNVWCLRSITQTGKKEILQTIFQLMPSRFGWRSSFDLWYTAVENKDSFADVSKAAVISRAKIGPDMYNRKKKYYFFMK